MNCRLSITVIYPRVKNLSLLRSSVFSSCLMQGKLGPLPATVLSTLSTAGASSASQHGHSRADLSNPSCFSSPVLEGAVTLHSPAPSSPTFPKQNLLRLYLTAHSHQHRAFPSHLISPSPSSCFVYPINSNHPLFPQHTRTQPHLQHLRQQKPPQNIQGTPSEDLHVWGNPRDWRFFFPLSRANMSS